MRLVRYALANNARKSVGAFRAWWRLAFAKLLEVSAQIMPSIRLQIRSKLAMYWQATLLVTTSILVTLLVLEVFYRLFHYWTLPSNLFALVSAQFPENSQVYTIKTIDMAAPASANRNAYQASRIFTPHLQ